MSVKKSKPPTTAQYLGAFLKSRRDIRPKDKGLDGEIDQLPWQSRAAILGCEFTHRPGAGPQSRRRDAAHVAQPSPAASSCTVPVQGTEAAMNPNIPTGGGTPPELAGGDACAT